MREGKTAGNVSLFCKFTVGVKDKGNTPDQNSLVKEVSMRSCSFIVSVKPMSGFSLDTLPHSFVSPKILVNLA